MFPCVLPKPRGTPAAPFSPSPSVRSSPAPRPGPGTLPSFSWSFRLLEACTFTNFSGLSLEFFIVCSHVHSLPLPNQPPSPLPKSALGVRGGEGAAVGQVRLELGRGESCLSRVRTMASEGAAVLTFTNSSTCGCSSAMVATGTRKRPSLGELGGAGPGKAVPTRGDGLPRCWTVRSARPAHPRSGLPAGPEDPTLCSSSSCPLGPAPPRAWGGRRRGAGPRTRGWARPGIAGLPDGKEAVGKSWVPPRLSTRLLERGTLFLLQFPCVLNQKAPTFPSRKKLDTTRLGTQRGPTGDFRTGRWPFIPFPWFLPDISPDYALLGPRIRRGTSNWKLRLEEERGGKQDREWGGNQTCSREIGS